jgi:hypothetical protein
VARSTGAQDAVVGVAVTGFPAPELSLSAFIGGTYRAMRGRFAAAWT